MSFTITNNFPVFVKELNTRKSELNRTAVQAISRGMSYFLGIVQKKYYSGRPGLNAPTGTLRRAWYMRTLVSGKGGFDTSVRLSNSMPYAHIHETGGKIKAKNGGYLCFPVKNISYRIKTMKSGKHAKKTTTSWVKVKEVDIPKRTDVIGEFGRTGIAIISREVSRSVNKVLKLRSGTIS